MNRDRVSPVVAFYQENPFVRRLRALGLEVHVFSSLRSQELRRYRSGSLIERYWGLLGAIRARWQLIRKLKIDLVHINNSPQVAAHDWLPASRIIGVPIIASAMGDAAYIDRRFRRAIIRRYNHYLPVSQYMRRSLLAQGVSPARVTMVRNGVDTDRIHSRIVRSREQVRHDLEVLPEQTLGVMVGNVRRWKGQGVVLEALAKVPSDLRSRLVIAFAGSDDPQNRDFRYELDQKTQDLGLLAQIRWLGRREDVPELFHAADFGLHASVLPEPFGLVMAECMATGTPVIAAQEGGASEIISPGTGWVYPGGQADSLAELFTKVLREPEQFRVSADDCRRRAKEFSAERMAAEMEAVYLSVTASRRRWW